MRQTSRIRLLLVVLAVLSLGAAACGDDDDSTAGGDDGQTLAAPLVIQADTVAGSENIPEEERAGSVCVLQSRFARNGEVVFRAAVVDAVTGEELDDSAITSITVALGDGETTLDMKYGGHPGSDPVDFFWTAGWDVPEDYPTGTVGYTITAEATDGRTATFEPFMVAPSELTITDEVLTPLEEEDE